MSTAELNNVLKIDFEGGFQCRLATDPDPTREKRGVSGYTYALAGESDLDQTIHFQGADIAEKDYRERGPECSLPCHDRDREKFGVFVTEVNIIRNGTATRWDCGLKGGTVNLLDGPKFVSWNQIVSDGVQRIATPVYPYKIEIRSGSLVLRRSDPITGDPAKDPPLYELTFADYQRRIPIYNRPSDEVLEAVGIADVNAYYQQRKEWLIEQLAREEDKSTRDEIAISNYNTRIRTINTYSQGAEPGGKAGFIEGRLALQNIWEHTINGADAVVEGDFNGKVDPCSPWTTRYWVGGWDGDVMRGYAKGWLAVPFIQAQG